MRNHRLLMCALKQECAIYIVCKSTQLRSLGILTDTANCMFLQTLSYDVYMNGVLSSLLTVASKHDGSDSTAYSNENGQLEVGLLQINIDAVRFWYACEVSIHL